MRYLYQLIIIACLLFSSSVHALTFFFDPLYWRATESVDWELSNNLNSTNQNITYKTIAFDFKPGFRVGVDYEAACWNTKFYYTKYYTKANDSDNGNLTSAFLAAKNIQTNPLDPSLDFFYQSGQVNFTINFNMIDWDVGKRFYVTDRIVLRPLVGLKGGWINQTINTNFQGRISVIENIKNDFKGIGPKVGVEGRLEFFCINNYQFDVVADFATSYLWGHWTIKDVLNDSAQKSYIIGVSDHDFGALAFQGMIGASLAYKQFSMTLGYEINDWLNQCQIFDDATGAHNNDLILQGITLRLAFDFN